MPRAAPRAQSRPPCQAWEGRRACSRPRRPPGALKTRQKIGQKLAADRSPAIPARQTASPRGAAPAQDGQLDLAAVPIAGRVAGACSRPGRPPGATVKDADQRGSIGAQTANSGQAGVLEPPGLWAGQRREPRR